MIILFKRFTLIISAIFIGVILSTITNWTAYSHPVFIITHAVLGLVLIVYGCSSDLYEAIFKLLMKIKRKQGEELTDEEIRAEALYKKQEESDREDFEQLKKSIIRRLFRK